MFAKATPKYGTGIGSFQSFLEGSNKASPIRSDESLLLNQKRIAFLSRPGNVLCPFPSTNIGSDDAVPPIYGVDGVLIKQEKKEERDAELGGETTSF